MFQEFKKFIMRGNVLDLAVGIVIGGAFGGIVSSFVNDVLMPPIGLALGSVDFKELYVVMKEGTAAAGPYASLTAAQEAGAVTLNYGLFVNTIINFLIIGFAIFMVIRAANRLSPPAPAPVPAATRECSFCLSTIPAKAIRCPHCTSELRPA